MTYLVAIVHINLYKKTSSIIPPTHKENCNTYATLIQHLYKYTKILGIQSCAELKWKDCLGYCFDCTAFYEKPTYER